MISFLSYPKEHAHMHMHTNTQKHACMCTHTHTHARMHAHIHQLYQTFIIPYSADGKTGGFQISAIVNEAEIHMQMQTPYGGYGVLWVICPGVKLQGRMEIINTCRKGAEHKINEKKEKR